MQYVKLDELENMMRELGMIEDTDSLKCDNVIDAIKWAESIVVDNDLPTVEKLLTVLLMEMNKERN